MPTPPPPFSSALFIAPPAVWIDKHDLASAVVPATTPGGAPVSFAVRPGRPKARGYPYLLEAGLPTGAALVADGNLVLVHVSEGELFRATVACPPGCVESVGRGCPLLIIYVCVCL